MILEATANIRGSSNFNISFLTLLGIQVRFANVFGRTKASLPSFRIGFPTLYIVLNMSIY